MGKGLQDESPKVRTAVLKALAGTSLFGDQTSITAVSTLLKDKDADVRGAAACTVGALLAPQSGGAASDVVRLLHQMRAQDIDLDVREKVESALHQIQLSEGRAIDFPRARRSFACGLF